MAQIPGYPYLPRPRIRFETISEAFELFKAEMAVWVLAGFITMFLSFACLAPVYIYMFATFLGHRTPDFGQLMRIYGYLLIAVTLVQVIQGICRAGMHNMAWKQLQGEGVSIQDFFSVGRQFPAIAGASLLIALATFVGSLACYVPGLIASGLLMFTFPIIVRKRIGPLAAMGESWDMLKGDLWMATGFNFVVLLLAGAGSLACGIGIVFTLPIWPIATTLVYRDYLAVGE